MSDVEIEINGRVLKGWPARLFMIVAVIVFACLVAGLTLAIEHWPANPPPLLVPHDPLKT